MSLLDEQSAPPTVHTLRIPSNAGDTPIHWTPGVRVEEDAARASFDAMKAKGYAAYKRQDGENIQVRRFDPAAGEIVMMPPIQGG